jgi:hypothetical protein
VLKFRAGECLGLDSAHLLELERRFHCHGEPQPAADHQQSISVRQRVDRALPMLFGRALQRRGKAIERALQRTVALPSGDDACTGDQLRERAHLIRRGTRRARFFVDARFEVAAAERNGRCRTQARRGAVALC